VKILSTLLGADAGEVSVNGFDIGAQAASTTKGATAIRVHLPAAVRFRLITNRVTGDLLDSGTAVARTARGHLTATRPGTTVPTPPGTT
jgi:hypothetical protein